MSVGREGTEYTILKILCLTNVLRAQTECIIVRNMFWILLVI